MEQNRPSSIIIQKEFQQNSSILAQGSPPSPPLVPRRRKNKMNISTKTNEELIMQSQQQLLEYVDRIDEQVKKIVKNHQAQFLLAYRGHLKLVKSQMQELKQRSLQSMNQHKHYLQHIQTLEKQLILFREQSLKLSEKNLWQAEKIEKMSHEIKLLKSQKQKEESKVIELTHKNKQLQILIFQYEKNQNDKESKEFQKSHFFSLNNTLQVMSNVTKRQTFKNSERPFTTQLKNKIREAHSINQSFKNRQPEAQIEQNQRKNSNNITKNVNVSKLQHFQRKIKSQHEGDKKDRFSLRQKMIKKIRYTTNHPEKELEVFQSKHFADRNQYQAIFIACVQEVRRQVLRRNGVLGLNYFKLNGPTDLVQFKKMDYYLLLQLFLKNEQVTQAVYHLLFAKKDHF